jgi:hypothetical protein
VYEKPTDGMVSKLVVVTEQQNDAQLSATFSILAMLYKYPVNGGCQGLELRTLDYQGLGPHPARH